MNIVIACLPEGDELTPEKKGELLGPELAGMAFGVLSEDSVVLVLKYRPLGTEVAIEKGVPADG